MDPSHGAPQSGGIISNVRTNYTEDLIKLLNEKNRGKDFALYLPLYRFARKFDWKSVKEFIDDNPAAKTAQINEFGSTILHLAICKNNCMWLVENILNSIQLPSLLEEADITGKTALSYAASVGNIEATKKLVEKNERLLLMKDTNGYTPLHHAARVGHKETVKFLWSKTTDKKTLLSGESGATLFRLLILSKLYGIALHILNQHMGLDENHLIKKEVLITLAQMPKEFATRIPYLYILWVLIYIVIPVTKDISTEENDYPLFSIVEVNPNESRTDNSTTFTNSGFFQQISNRFGKEYLSYWNNRKQRDPWINDIHDVKLRRMQPQALELVKLICEEMIPLTFEQAYKILNEPLFMATRLGIVKFVNEIIEAYPNSACFFDKDNRNIFQLAILYRQGNIFNLIYKLDHAKQLVICSTDNNGNNILHLAGLVLPSNRILMNRIFPMKWEFRWFKGIKNEVIHLYPTLLEDRNHDQLTPKEVFFKEHKDLVKESHQWMKNTAQSYTVVTALITTVTFAAVFTIPGGTNDKGKAKYWNDSTLIAFVVLDAIAFFSSLASLMMFLGIVMSHYLEKDVLAPFPKKWRVAHFTLYVSLLCLSSAFFLALEIIIPHSSDEVNISMVEAAAILATFIFVFSHQRTRFDAPRPTAENSVSRHCPLCFSSYQIKVFTSGPTSVLF